METITTMEKCEILKKNIDEITSEELQLYLNSLRNYSKSTIKKFVDQLNQAYKFAQSKGYIIQNLALQTSDINLQKNLISITKTLTKDKDRNIIMGDRTKTYAGNRTIPIPEFLIDDIKVQMILAENHKDKLLFVDTRNQYLSPQRANEKLKNIAKKLGITGITTHSLRHTYGTRCIEAGMRAVAVQRLMGHTDISVTLNTYTSIFNKYKEQELAKVNEYYLNNDIFTKRKLLNVSDELERE